MYHAKILNIGYRFRSDVDLNKEDSLEARQGR